MGIFSEALDILAGRWAAIVVACLLPLTGTALLEVIPIGEAWLIFVPLLLVQLCFYTCIAVAVHRVVLIGSESGSSLALQHLLSGGVFNRRTCLQKTKRGSILFKSAPSG